MKQYIELMDDIMHHGSLSDDRTGTGTIKLFGTRMEFDLTEGFPLVTTKHVPFKLVLSELLWFISGSTNINDLYEYHPNHIWDEWADEHGELGPVYGKQWRDWNKNSMNNGIDQLQNVITQLWKNPNSRRHVVSAWNPEQLREMALEPCHLLFQFFVDDNKLSCQIYQRSCDFFLGVPFNIASYALLTHMVAAVNDMEVDKLVWVGGDTHIYTNHFKQVGIQLGRTPKSLPTLVMDWENSIDDFEMHDFKLEDYKPHSHIPAPISV